MKKIIKFVFEQICMICFGITAINGILIAVTKNYGGELKIDYLFPLSIVVCSILSGLLILIYFIPKIPFILKIVLHFICLVGVVTLMSYLFGWVSSFYDLLIVYAVLLVIYVVVWIINYNNDIKSAKKINEALENTRDEE